MGLASLDRLEKLVPLQGERAQSLKVFNLPYVQNRNEKEETEQQQTYQFNTR